VNQEHWTVQRQASLSSFVWGFSTV